jgi:hypothetical protein
MADVSAIFGVLLIFAIAFPGMLIAWWLLFPSTVERARLRLERTPWQTFWFGGILTAVLVIPTVILLALPFGAAKFLGWATIVVLLTLSSLGSAGITATMGERLTQLSTTSPFSAFLRGAIALEMAVFFPVLGWFIVFPLTIVTSIGATGFAILRWSPKTKPVPTAPVPSPKPVQA